MTARVTREKRESNHHLLVTPSCSRMTPFFRPTVFLALITLSSGAMTASTTVQDEWVPNHLKPVELAEGFANLHSLDMNVDKDRNKRVFLIGLDEKAKAPRGGYGLVVVIPGGDGGPGFANFVHGIHKECVPEGFLTLQIIAPEWVKGQLKTKVWSIERNRLSGAKFTTEEFVLDAIDEVASRTRLNKKKIFSLSWSSGGPPAYSLSLQKKTPIQGSLIRASVFFPDNLPPLSRAKGHRYCLMQSPTDEITKFHHAESARDALEKKRAEVRFVSYEGGHAWPKPIYPKLKSEMEWLLDE
jgi:hypothetical protein